MCLYSFRVHICGEIRRDIWHRRNASKGKNWLDTMQRAFAVITIKNSLCFATTSGVESAKNLLCHPGSDECRGSPACLPAMEQGAVAPMLRHDAQHAVCADISMQSPMYWAH